VCRRSASINGLMPVRPYECHHKIDSVRRSNLRLNLMAYSRLTRCVRQKCRVEQRNQRLRNVLRTAVRESSFRITAEHDGWIRQLHGGELIATKHVAR